MFMHKMKKNLIIVLTLGTLPFAQANSITGAGASFPLSNLCKWASLYEKRNWE